MYCEGINSPSIGLRKRQRVLNGSEKAIGVLFIHEHLLKIDFQVQPKRRQVEEKMFILS